MKKEKIKKSEEMTEVLEKAAKKAVKKIEEQ